MIYDIVSNGKRYRVTVEEIVEALVKEKMSLSDTGLQLIKSFEGFRDKAYKCPSGVWTIGYGHTKGVKEGDVVSDAAAEKFLKEDVADAENCVNAIQTFYGFNQNQFDALVSFTFNCGAGNLTKLHDNLKRDKPTIGDKILLYTKSNGKELAGLVRRRKAENQLYFM